MSLVLNMVGGVSGGLKDGSAILSVTVPAASTVTASKDGVTLQPSLWLSGDNSSTEVALFTFLPAQFDSTTPWTVTATLGTWWAESTTVLITTNREYEVQLRYLFYLYNRGDQRTTVTGGWANSHGGGSGVRMNTDNIEIYQVATSGRGASVYTTNQINLTDYSTIHFIFTNSAASTYTKGGISDATSFTDGTFLKSSVFPVSASEAEMVVDISSITGLHYPRIYGGIDNTLRIYKVWLE